jgi:glyoxylase-like metal-dependent hydrolase (beta-lactamase superfamily II)
MLAQMERVAAGARIESVVNTHANGDHCWSNSVVAGARIIGSQAATREMLSSERRLQPPGSHPYTVWSMRHPCLRVFK